LLKQFVHRVNFFVVARGFVTASHLQHFEKLFPARRRDHTEVFSLCGRRKGEGADESFEKS
jgi:hypothetical protein